jgi:hypothetical protein
MSAKVNNLKFEVMTPVGWQRFDGMKKTIVPVHVVLLLNSGEEIKCSPTHKIKLLNGVFIDAMDIKIGTKLSDKLTVTVNTFKEEPLEVFDLLGVDGEEYITNGVISHNCAFIDDADIIWTAASSTLSTGGKAILLSTPNGVGNFFHKMWQQAETKSNSFNPILLDWKVHPERDQAWRDRQTEMMGEMQSSQEHDASFIFSGNTVVNPQILEFYKKTYVTEPISKQGFDGNLWIWEYPDANRTYIAAADVARGDGEDYSTIHIIDAERSVQVAEYKGKIPTKEFGNLMVSLATEYNDALLIPDNSSIGWSSVQQIIDRGYRNLFYMSKDMQYIDVEHQASYKSERNLVAGFVISQRTRPLIIAKLEEYMRETSITIRSSRTLAELETFIWKNGRAEALTGYNDDLVMALGIGLWVRDTALRLRQQGIELTKLALNHTDYSTTPFMKRGNLPNSMPVDPYQMQIGNMETEDIRWLVG